MPILEFLGYLLPLYLVSGSVRISLSQSVNSVLIWKVNMGRKNGGWVWLPKERKDLPLSGVCTLILYSAVALLQSSRIRRIFRLTQ